MIQTKETTTFEKYPEYKDSGSYWSGHIPEEWNALPIRAIFEERNEKNDGPKTDFILSVTKDRGVIPYDEKGAIGNNKSEEIERYKLVYPNDFVINKMNVVIGSLGMSKYFGAFSQVYLVYKPKTSQINIEYYSYIFSNPTFYKSLIKFCTGIMELRESLNKSDFKKIILPFPNFDTQTSIVKFLDNKTSKIDTAIAQKEQMIALLKERKQIMIQNAVTGKWSMVNGKWGETPKKKMKDSGVEWIGEIPVHWEVKALKYIARLESGEAISSESFINEGYPVFGGNGFRGFAQTFTNDGHYSLIGRQGALCGNINYAKGKFFASEHAIVVYHNQGINVTWLGETIKVADFNRLSQSAAQPGIAVNVIKNVLFPYPSIDEQNRIDLYIKTQSTKIDQTISLKQSQIEKLKEYKAILIDGAVTGKIKVS